MTLKGSAFLALLGMILVTLLLLSGLVSDLIAAMRGLIPAVRLLTSLIYAFASFGVTAFLFAFYRDH
jgi:hypothetical protein